MKNIALLLFSTVLCCSCAIVNQNEVGIKRKFGKIKGRIYGAGPVGYNPFTTNVLTVPISTRNMEKRLGLPSKEGLTINASISILYHVEGDKVMDVLKEIGTEYEDAVIFPVFRSAAADVCAGFFAKDLHSGERYVIEEAIAERMREILEPRGFAVEAVLMKSIELPEGLSRAIEAKLRSEQLAQQMEFEIKREELEAKRKRIEAEGIRDAQIIISQGLNDTILRFNSIEALKELANSPNGKLIITNGKTPLILDGSDQ